MSKYDNQPKPVVNIGTTTPPTPDAGVTRFTLIWRDGGYHVSEPSIGTMEVVSAAAYDAVTAQLAAARADNDVLHHEVQMQLMELGMKAIGDHNRQFFHDDDDDAARTGAR